MTLQQLVIQATEQGISKAEILNLVKGDPSGRTDQ